MMNLIIGLFIGWLCACLRYDPHYFESEMLAETHNPTHQYIRSETYKNYVALKLKDMRKTQGRRDHIIIEV